LSKQLPERVVRLWDVPTPATPPRNPVRVLASIGLAAYAVVRLRNLEHWDLLDDVNLAIHEAGHVLFQPLGDPLVVLGGSLFQVLVPLAFVTYFFVRRDWFAASVVTAWVAASLGNVALYIADARAQELPLLGGENTIHDWWYLLTEWDLLAQDRDIAAWIRLASAMAFIVAALGAALNSRRTTLSDVPATGMIREPD
jgi:hypothetical protein